MLIGAQLHHKDYDQIGILLDYYRPLKDRLGQVDIVEAAGPLDAYRLVVAPSLNVIPDGLAKNLADYVRRGGHLVLGPRSGMKDEFNRLHLERQPGPLAELLGGRVEQFYALDESIAVGNGAPGAPGVPGGATIWAEHLSTSAPDTEIVLRYGKANGWLDGHPAAISRKVGRGRITYLGAVVDPATMRNVLDRALGQAGVAREFAPPEDVEIMRRAGNGREVLIVVNHGRETRTVSLPAPMRDVLDGGSKSSLTLAPEGVAVLHRAITTGEKK